MILEQAIFGYKQLVGHTLLSLSSPQIEELSDELCSLTDLPGNPPYGITWKPYVSGYPVGDFYAVSKTFVDTDATRGDTVYSHVVLVRKMDLDSINSLQQIVDLLPIDLDKSIKARQITYEPKQSKSESSNINSELVFQLSNKEDKAIVCLGNGEDYTESICKIWDKLWGGIRFTFTFKIGFSAERIKPNDTVIISPSNLKHEWVGFPIVEVSSISDLSTEVELWLGGEAELSESLLGFWDQINHENSTFSDLKLAESSLRLIDKTDRDSVRNLARNLAYLSPNKAEAKPIKSLVLSNLLNHIEKSDFQVILKLRNFNVDSYSGGNEVLKKSVIDWLKNIVVRPEMEMKVITEGFLQEQNGWWYQAIRLGVKETFESLDGILSKLFWKLIQEEIKLLDELVPFVLKTRLNEAELIKETPKKMNAQTINPILPYLIEVGWFSLHALLLTKIHAPQQAIREHLLIDNEEDSENGVLILVNELNIEELISFCEKQEEDRIIRALGIACSNNLKLMKKLDQTNAIWRKVWLSSIKITDQPWIGITNQRKVMASILDQLLLKVVIDTELLHYLSQTDFSDLSYYHKRLEVWKLIPQTPRNHFLRSTVKSLLSKSEGDGNMLRNLEDELIQEVNYQVAKEKLLENPTVSGKLKFQIIESFDVSEALFILFVKDNVIKFSKEDAARIGEIITKRKWDKAYKVIKSSTYLNRDLKDAVREEPTHGSQQGASLIDSIFNMKPSYKMKMEKRKILFMSSGPEDQGYLSLNREMRKVEEILESAKNRDQFDLKQKVAVKFETLAKSILEIEPEIIHFSGHGETNGLALEKEDGTTHFVENDTIRRIFEINIDNLKCVLLNSCYSLDQAREISKLGIAVIGMNDSIEDNTAINFSRGFYTSLGAGKDIMTCFRTGLAYVSVDSKEELDIPQLWLDGSLEASN
jgi:hypothetical protein